MTASEAGIILELGAVMTTQYLANRGADFGWKTAALLFALGALSTACGGNAESDAAGGAAGVGGGTGATGGSATGGGGTGGGGTGGAGTGGGTAGGGSGGVGASGGSGGLGGAAGVGGAGGTGIGPECTEGSQCKLFSDCCTCVALAPGEPEPIPCPAMCIQDQCSALGVTQTNVACTAGRCTAGITCDAQAICAMVPPTCDPGMVPSILGGCWGPCVPATECASVPSCASCSGALETCVTVDHQSGDSSTRHCVDIPKGCEGTPSCACMSSNVCIPPFSACNDLSGVKGMLCSCPNC